MSTLQFYQDQARREQLAADAATLDNVRERCERAAKAWTMLADRIEQTDAFRASRLAAAEPKDAATAGMPVPAETE